MAIRTFAKGGAKMCTMSRQCLTMSGQIRCINPYIFWTLFRILAPPYAYDVIVIDGTF